MPSPGAARLRPSARGRLRNIPPVTFTVSTEYDGERLDRFLVSVVPGQSRSQLQKLIEDGLVTIDGRTAKANHRLKAGASVAVVVPELRDATPLPEDLELPIVYEDPDIVVVDKPPGMNELGNSTVSRKGRIGNSGGIARGRSETERSSVLRSSI